MTHKKFQEILVQDLILQLHEVNITVRGKFIWGPAESTGGQTFTTLANQRKNKDGVRSLNKSG
jgi:hypothetical protein